MVLGRDTKANAKTCCNGFRYPIRPATAESEANHKFVGIFILFVLAHGIGNCSVFLLEKDSRELELVL